MELNGKDVCPFCGNRNIAVALAAGGNVTTRREKTNYKTTLI